MEAHASLLPLKVNSNLRRKKWTLKEKKIVLNVLHRHGHKNLENFTNSLPHRTEFEIKRLLNKFKLSAEAKFRRKHDQNVQLTLSTVHPWMPFIKNYCNLEPYVHEHLIAFTLPLMERYKIHPPSQKNEDVNFQCAYRGLFNALLEQKFPDLMNHQTFSMMYASLNQLMDEIRTETTNFENDLAGCVKRCLDKKPLMEKRKKVIQLPEVNILGFLSKEINHLCEER